MRILGSRSIVSAALRLVLVVGVAGASGCMGAELGAIDGADVRGSQCGNGRCSGSESCGTCPADCGSCVADSGAPSIEPDGAIVASDAGDSLDTGTAEISPCGGPVVVLSGTTSSRYSQGTVADGTLFDLRAWYSNAVGNTSAIAFTVGSGNGPRGVCVRGGVVNGHIPLAWSWSTTHSYGGKAFLTTTRALASIHGARVHNVEDGWGPREYSAFSNTGTMLMRNTYMTAIRDDAIENDHFFPGRIEDSLFDGIWTFLSEQNQTGTTPTTIGAGEDLSIYVTRVYVRLYTTNGGESGPGRWFKWQGRGSANHRPVITDSVFAVDRQPRNGWDNLAFPTGTTWHGTNFILWLGAPGAYGGPRPSGVTFLEGTNARSKWNEVRNAWLNAHGYDPRPTDDLNPMDDPVVAPR